MANFEKRIRIGGTGTLTTYRGSFTGATGALEGTEPNDDAGDGEIAGEILDGEEIYGFNGVPTGFTANPPDDVWNLDIELDMGCGFVEQVPTFLNAAEVAIRSEGAHYLLSVPEPGMILRGGTADKPDQVMTEPNTLVAGNVRGGEDSYRIWPPMCGFDAVADHPAEILVRGAQGDWAGWKSIPVVRPEMGV